MAMGTPSAARPTATPGRYEVTVEQAMPGPWQVLVLFGDERTKLDITVTE